MTMKIIKKIYHRKTLIGMKDYYRKKLAELEIVEVIITEDIIKGNINRRKELNDTQKVIKSTEKFLKALQKLK